MRDVWFGVSAVDSGLFRRCLKVCLGGSYDVSWCHIVVIVLYWVAQSEHTRGEGGGALSCICGQDAV